MAFIKEKLGPNAKIPGPFTADDYTIKRAAVFKKHLKLKMFHELLEVCISDGKTDYYVLMDRGVSSGTAWTSIGIYYIGSGSATGSDNNSNCNPESEHWIHKISPKFFILKRNRIQRDSGFAITSFSKLIDQVNKYVVDNPEYSRTSNNCQHFATGLYNTITNAQTKITNNIASLFCKRKPHFFTVDDEGKFVGDEKAPEANKQEKKKKEKKKI